MSRRSTRLLLIAAMLALLPFSSPAPLIYTPGEGWTYEAVGSEGTWRRTRAKDELQVAWKAFYAKDYGLASKAARHLVYTWPLSDYAPQAQYLLGRCYEERHMDEKAFKEYELVLQKYPQSENLGDVLHRQYEIAGRFLNGQWFRAWGYIPYPTIFDPDRIATMYEQIVKAAPYSDVAPEAQLKIGEAREKQKDYPEAVTAYETAADRYSDQPQIASDAMYRAGMAYEKQAKTAEYDQGAAGQAIASLTDFMTVYPDDTRVPAAQKTIDTLKGEEARGNYEIARFYEKQRKWNGALIYYNEVLLQDPNSPLAPTARDKIDSIKKRLKVAAN